VNHVTDAGETSAPNGRCSPGSPACIGAPECKHEEHRPERQPVPRVTESDSCQANYRRCRVANATPDPDFKYRSKATARHSSENSMTTSTDHGRYLAV